MKKMKKHKEKEKGHEKKEMVLIKKMEKMHKGKKK